MQSRQRKTLRLTADQHRGVPDVLLCVHNGHCDAFLVYFEALGGDDPEASGGMLGIQRGEVLWFVLIV
jgi:hypothetical protein